VADSYSEPHWSDSHFQATLFKYQFYSPTYAWVSQGFLYHPVTCYTILYLLYSPPVTSTWIWINELMYDEYLLHSDITQRALPDVTPRCYDAGFLMNIQQRTNLSINICRIPHNVYTTVILKLNFVTLTHFSLSSRDSWCEEYYYKSVFEIFAALFQDVTSFRWIRSRRLFGTLGTDHPWTRHTPVELNPILLQFTVLFKSITSSKTIRLPIYPSLGNPCWSNIYIRMYLRSC